MSETIVNPVPEVKLTPKDFQTDQDVRWCPGCGDYSTKVCIPFFRNRV
jgi:2-oxoglutarate ferredoxin oxidoreductase subunit beta